MNQLDESAISPWSRCAVFLINLDRSPDRLQLADQNLASAQVPYARVAGFDASKEDLMQCKVEIATFRRTHGRVAPRNGELGCYQSHLKAIQAFIESEKEFGIILEDDAQAQPFLTDSVRQLIEWSEDWDIVPLFHFHSGGPVRIKQASGFRLSMYLAHVSSAAAYMLNRRAATLLLAHMAIQRACVDHALFEKWVHGLRLRGIQPMPVGLSAQAKVSTIGVEKSGKLPFFLRLPTFASRSSNALKILRHSMVELMRERLKQRG
jgi:glycosyl transferase family 25